MCGEGEMVGVRGQAGDAWEESGRRLYGAGRRLLWRWYLLKTAVALHLSPAHVTSPRAQSAVSHSDSHSVGRCL